MIAEKEKTMSTGSYKLQGFERETVIVFNETGDPAEVFTYNPAIIRRLDGLHEEGEQVELVRAEIINGIRLREYRVPKSWVSVRRPRKLNLTEEQKQERAVRLRGLRSEC